MAQVAQPQLDLPRGWQDRASCREIDSEDFFPPGRPETNHQRDQREARAKRVCAGCVVRPECLEWSLAIGEPHGVWGGLGEVERRRVLARQSRAS